ncbi:MAG: 3-oxoadipyl-CoA thiolase [Pseudomonadota bacterium]
MENVYICDYIRTPIGRYGGSLSSVRADDLGAAPLRALAARNPHMNLDQIDEVVFGCANQAGEDNRNVARMSLLLAGFPETVPGTTVNRLCGSGMDAVLIAARMIKAGEADLVVAGGTESMSRAPFVLPKATKAFARSNEIHDTTIGWRLINPEMDRKYGTDSMPQTAENVATDYKVSRSDQDKFALRSQQRTQLSTEQGKFAKEVIPVAIQQRRGPAIVVEVDEHPRAGSSLESLTSLRPIVATNGTITAGNSSGVNDGAAALILASERAVIDNNLTPIAKFLGGATSGVAPRVMGIGPISATTKLMQRLQLTQKDFSLIELNEAFAAQSLATLRGLGISDDDGRVNPNGGAIALGHPLGMSGARITGTAAVNISAGQRSLSTMCVGVGQGIAIVLEGVR